MSLRRCRLNHLMNKVAHLFKMSINVTGEQPNGINQIAPSNCWNSNEPLWLLLKFAGL